MSRIIILKNVTPHQKPFSAVSLQSLFGLTSDLHSLKMYGLLLENLAEFIRIKYGEGKWESVRRHAGIDTVAFSTHYVYSETLMQRLAKSACLILSVDEKTFFENLGSFFVQYVSQYGYDKVLSVLGRHLRDFLNGLDNLHEYLKFTYPKMRAPSFYCETETAVGLKLHYRTKRRGLFVPYVIGQMKQVATQFYNQTLEIHLVSEEMDADSTHVVFDLLFDNRAFFEAPQDLVGTNFKTPVEASTLFELFPFCIVFNSDMEIKRTGHALTLILKDLVGQGMTEAFDLTRPMVPFCFNEVMQRRNNIFEVLTLAPLHDVNLLELGLSADEGVDEISEGIRLRLRGQMLYMDEWDHKMMLYLANPVMPNITSLCQAGLYVNDLALHDCSRDMVLTGTQQSVELKLALDQEQQKSRKLVDSIKKLDEEMKRTDELLYQMIPKQVADRLRQGENPVDTCQTFDKVSILFSDIVSFTEICTKITPMQVVTCLNHMYSLFDQLCQRNDVYKVETIGDSYMVVSGAPIKNVTHHERIVDMALDMVDAACAIDNPAESDKSLRIRVGCHTGCVVAGIVGIKMPRYCLFGDAVNIASRMEATSEPGKIQISEACRNLLPQIYECEERGTVTVKGKGEMTTYFVTGRVARIPLTKFSSKFIVWSVPQSHALSTEAIGLGRPLQSSGSISLGDSLDSAVASISQGVSRL